MQILSTDGDNITFELDTNVKETVTFTADELSAQQIALQTRIDSTQAVLDDLNERLTKVTAQIALIP